MGTPSTLLLSNATLSSFLNSTIGNTSVPIKSAEKMTLIYSLLLPFMFIILLIAVVGNGVIVASAHRLTSPVSPYLRLCVSLAAADMWAAFLVTCGLVVNSLLPIIFGIRSPTRCFDASLEILRISGMLTSDMHLFALAINQFIGTIWPLKYKMIVTSRRLRTLVFLLWVVPILFTLTWFLSFADDGLRHPKCHFNFYHRFTFRITVFTIFMLPLFATLIIYGIILQHLLKAKAEFKAQTESQGSNRMVPPRKNHVNSRLKLVWTTLLIVSTFFLSWGICVFYFLIVCIEGCPLIYMKDISLYAGIVFSSSVNILVMFKLAANPFIYTLRIRAIRRSVESLFRYRIGSRRSCPTAPSSCTGKKSSGNLKITQNHLSSASFTVVDNEHSSFL